MTKFSDRIGVTSPPKEFFINGISKEVRTSFWNLLYSIFESSFHDYWMDLVKVLYIRFFKLSASKVPYEDYKCRIDLEEKFNQLPWFEVFNLMELIITLKVTTDISNVTHVTNVINSILTAEYSGYRMVNGEFIEITNETEINSINDALKTPVQLGMESVSTHIAKSVSLLSKKPNPDYLNSIKESISAVESASKLISKETTGGLQKAISVLEKKINIHPQLKQAFINLYNYTSDENGIRHALLENPNSGFDEAKYMLISCSAFVNYLISKMQSK